MPDVGSTELTETNYEKLHTRQSEIWSIEDIEKLPAKIADTLKSESIMSVAVAPLTTASGPLGVLAMAAVTSMLSDKRI